MSGANAAEDDIDFDFLVSFNNTSYMALVNAAQEKSVCALSVCALCSLCLCSVLSQEKSVCALSVLSPFVPPFFLGSFNNLQHSTSFYMPPP